MAVTSTSRRVRPRLRTVAIAAFAVLLPVAAWSLWDYIEARRFARLVAAIEQRGEPTSWSFVAAAPNAPTNAARYYAAAAALLTDGGYSPLALDRIRAWPVADGAEAVARVQSWLDENREAEALLAKATDLRFEGYRSQQDAAAQRDGLDRLATLAYIRGFERAAAGDPDGVAAALSRELRIAHARGLIAPGLSSYVGLRMAARGLRNFPAAAGASDGLLNTLQVDIRQLARDDIMETFGLRQRASLLGRYWRAGAGWYGTPAEFRTSASWPLIRPYLAHVAIDLAQELEAFVAQARLPWPERIGPHVPAEPHPRWRIGYLSASHAVASERRGNYLLSKMAVAALAELRAADATLAVERFRRQHGCLPDTLDATVPAYLPEVPVDPFSGGPLKYLVAERAFTVYSVGENRTDDQGSAALWRFENERPKKQDIGFRIPF